MDLLHLRALLNEQYAHDAKPVVIAAPDGRRYTVTGFDVTDTAEAALIVEPAEES